MTDEKMTIAVCIPTFHRPKMLAEALKSLVDLKTPDKTSIHLFICDNDPNGESKSVVNSHQESLPFDLTYLIEPKRGIVHIRNRLLKEVEGFDFLAFMDDDECADAEWIVGLFQTSQKFNAQAVAGRVIYELPKKAAKWLFDRDFYNGGVPVTGSKMRGASTNNVLIDLNFVKKHGLKFHEAFNMSGGSDSFFFREVRKEGGVIVSCQEAITYESVPETRAREEWILNRAYKSAVSEYKRNRIRKGVFKASLIAISYAFWLLICYVFGHMIYPFSSYSYKVFNRRRWRKVKAIFNSMRGGDHIEYGVIHGE